MLEHAGLLLCPWRLETSVALGNGQTRGKPSTPTLLRRVLDLHTHQFLGLVRPEPPRAWPGFRWLTRRAWQIVETEDESLLLMLFGPWGLLRPWEVRDAEDRLVCTIHRGKIFDVGGSLRVHTLASAPRRHFLSLENRELAALTPTGQNLELRFTSLLEGDPYAKMAILGAALTLDA